MLKALTVFGTRPEAIKMAPVVKEFQKFPDRAQAVVCVTGQHRTMLDQVLQIFEIVPDFDLDLMAENQSLSVLTGQALEGVCKVIAHVKPDVVLVQGDTTTAMASALAAFYQKIPLGHIEAGLRTYDPYTPFPEEMNRRLISTLTTFHFAPTETAAKALRAEGVPAEQIFLTGNTVIDALQAILCAPGTSDLPAVPAMKMLILVTAHRRESYGEPIREICAGLRELVRRNPGIEIVYPVHLNPNIQEPVHQMLDSEERIHLVPPLPYAQFVQLMGRAYFILTDSGGMQEEAPALGKPVLVLRRVTERPEAVEAGVVKIIGTDSGRIVAESERLLNDAELYQRMSRRLTPYGDGHAAERIVRVLLERLMQGGSSLGRLGLSIDLEPIGLRHKPSPRN